MENDRKLNDCMMLNSMWQLASEEVIDEIVSLEGQTYIYSEILIAQVLSGAISMECLRSAVRWLNTLDKEAYESFQDRFTFSQADKQEAIARRLAHHAGRTALQSLKPADEDKIYKLRWLGTR